MKPLRTTPTPHRRLAPWLLYGLLAIATTARAQAWLPSDNAVREALDSHPAIAAAQADREGQQAKASATRAGSNETEIRVLPQRRQVREGATQNYNEALIGIDRRLRLWGKADADAAIADATGQAAEIALQDARHELSRDLLTLWFAVLRAHADRLAQDTALERAAELTRTVQSRVRHGDAAKLDQELASAELERVRASALAAQTADRSAAAALRASFPQMSTAAPLPAGLPATLPAPLEGDEQGLRQRYVEHSHALRLAAADSERMQRVAQRIDLDRRPDPTVGAYVSSERGGAERIVGLSLMVPLTGSYREANARAALAEAQAVSARQQRTQRQLTAEFDGLWESMQGNRRAAIALQASAAQQAAAAAKVAKAYTLGEAGIAEVLTARRAAEDTRRQADLALVDAAQTQYRMALDLHELWDFDE
jgi:outer membrane protein TolC